MLVIQLQIKRPEQPRNLSITTEGIWFPARSWEDKLPDSSELYSSKLLHDRKIILCVRVFTTIVEFVLWLDLLEFYWVVHKMISNVQNQAWKIVSDQEYRTQPKSYHRLLMLSLSSEGLSLQWSTTNPPSYPQFLNHSLMVQGLETGQTLLANVFHDLPLDME